MMLNHTFFHDNQYPFKRSITEEAGEIDVTGRHGEKWLFSLVSLSNLLRSLYWGVTAFAYGAP